MQQTETVEIRWLKSILNVAKRAKIRAILQLRQESRNAAVPASKPECFIIEKLNLQKISHTAAYPFGSRMPQVQERRISTK